MHDAGNLTTIVEHNLDEFEILTRDLGFRNETFNQNNVGLSNVNNLKHFYTTKEYNVVYNSSIQPGILTFTFKSDNANAFKSYMISSAVPANVGNDYYTTIYIVYTLSGPIRIELFAVTRVPTLEKLLGNSLDYASGEKNSTSYTSGDISLLNASTATKKVLTNSVVKNKQVDLSWGALTSLNATNTPYWFNQGNYIYVCDSYGQDANYYDLDFSVGSNSKLHSTISGSGSHKLMFKDLAGNVHKFASTSSLEDPYVYTLTLLDEVIYHINYNNQDLDAIQYGVFNDSLTVVIDSQFLTKDFYKLENITISATRNGSAFAVEKDSVLTFTQPGKYVLNLNAKYEDKSLNTAVYNFTILSSTSARLAFEYVEVGNYEFTQVIKDEIDVTNQFVDERGKISSIFISASSQESGNGTYKLTLLYDKQKGRTLTFSFVVNDFKPNIYCNVEHGETTTSNIVLKYDASTIFEQLGTCYVVIKTYDTNAKDFVKNSTYSFVINETTTGEQNITIDKSNSYFIQLQTESGNVVLSFRVNKVDPLNVFSIIIIVVSVIAAGALVFVIIKLRTRMKIR